MEASDWPAGGIDPELQAADWAVQPDLCNIVDPRKRSAGIPVIFPDQNLNEIIEESPDCKDNRETMTEIVPSIQQTKSQEKTEIPESPEFPRRPVIPPSPFKLPKSSESPPIPETTHYPPLPPKRPSTEGWGMGGGVAFGQSGGGIWTTRRRGGGVWVKFGDGEEGGVWISDNGDVWYVDDIKTATR